MNSRRLAAALIAATLLPGCVSTTTASLKPEGSLELVELHRTTTGLVFGPCMPAPGHVDNAFWIRVKGSGPVFGPSDIELVDDRGAPWANLGVLQGTVSIERGHHRVVVALRENGKAMFLNGTYRIDGQPR